MAGIHAEVAGARSEYWSSFTSNPAEVVLEAAKKAKEEIGKTLVMGWQCLKISLSFFLLWGVLSIQLLNDLMESFHLYVAHVH